MKRIFSSLGAFALCVTAAMAVPAKPTPIAFTQPDGSVIYVTVRGDERHHFCLSDDGYLLVNEGDAFYYGNVDDVGRIVSSSLLAKPMAKRTEQDRAYLSTVDMRQVMQKFSAKKAEKLTAAPVMRTPGVGTFPGTAYPTTGNSKGLVVLVEYADKKFNLEDPYDYFSRMLHERNFSDNGATGSARDYFIASSNGLFQPEFDLYGPVTLPNNMSYYGANDSYGNDKNPEKMAIHACNLLDNDVDFSQYDCDGDGEIDNLYIFYAGLGEASSSVSNTVWPHSWEVSAATSVPYIYDGVRLNKYACSNEWEGNTANGSPCGIGTFVHEFSHVLGLPDLYSTSYTDDAFTPGGWSIMDYGPYNNDGHTPPLYGIFERNALNWCQPISIEGEMSAMLHPIEQNVGFVIETEDPNEFFLLENRQKTGWDAYIPGHGMLIWHVCYNSSVWFNNTVNNVATRQYVDIEEADDRKTEATRAGDSFPGKYNITSFTDDTSPSMRTWQDEPLERPITDITEEDGIITFNVCGGGDLVEAKGEIYDPGEDPDDPGEDPDDPGEDPDDPDDPDDPEPGPAFADLAVEPLDAIEITDSSFVACWNELDGAVAYRLQVFAHVDAEGNESELITPALGETAVANGVVSQKVSGLQAGWGYFYIVFATNGEEESAPSVPVEVILKQAGIENAVVDAGYAIGNGMILANSEIDVYTLDGRCVYRASKGALPLNSGIYIVRALGGEASKAVVR